MKNKLLLFILSIMILFPVLSYAGYENVDVNKAEEYINSGEYILVDVRTPDEFKSGHIKKAYNIDFYNNLEQDFLKQFPDKNKKYLLYCRSGNRSVYAARLLSGLGYKNIVNMQGGIVLWTAFGKKLER